MAINLDGSEYIEKQTLPGGINSTPVTIAGWANISDATDNGTLACLGFDGTGLSGAVLQLEGGGTETVRAHHIENGFASNGFSETSAITTDVWQHWCGVFASSSSRFAYLNGISGSENTTTVGAFDNVDTLMVGGFPWSSSSTIWTINGEVGEIGVWNVALIAAEVAALAAGYSPLLVRPSNLVSYIPLYNTRRYQDYFDNSVFSITGSPNTRAHPGIIMPSAQILQFPPVVSGRIMSSLAYSGGLAGTGGIAGKMGGLAG